MKILKCMLAGITAIAILCGVFLIYTFTPVHEPNPKGNTDYIWPANARWFKMTEGIATGRFDANGYNNLQVVEDPDILIVGSSHMEATNVSQDRNTAYLLEQALGEDYTVYNTGISNHDLLKVCSLLPQTLERYTNTKYIIVETDIVSITQATADALTQGKAPYFPSNDTGLVAAIQRLPFARLVYFQIRNGLLDLFMPGQNAVSEEVPKKTPANRAAYEAFFSHIKETVEDTDVQLIFFYHPTVYLLEDGSAACYTDPEQCRLFAENCEKNGFVFVDMTQPFLRMYAQEHKLPHGFVTGKIGYGHLNADGHKAIAEELAKTIARMEQEGSLCK